MAATALVPNWVQVVLASYSQDPASQELLGKLALDANDVPNYTLTSGLLRYRSRI
jgi:hypothetical protein